jgi:hypothetical protein
MARPKVPAREFVERYLAPSNPNYPMALRFAEAAHDPDSVYWRGGHFRPGQANDNSSGPC